MVRGDSNVVVKLHIYKELTKKLKFTVEVKIMRAKKIIFSVVCIAMLLCTMSLTVANAMNKDDTVNSVDLTTSSYGDYSDYYDWNGLYVSAIGISGVPVSYTRVDNRGDQGTFFVEVETNRYRGSKLEDSDGENLAIAKGEGAFGGVRQERSSGSGELYNYMHIAYLHAGSVPYSPIMKSYKYQISL